MIEIHSQLRLLKTPPALSRQSRFLEKNVVMKSTRNNTQNCRVLKYIAMSRFHTSRKQLRPLRTAPIGGAMVGVVIKFSIASICLCAAPIAILYGFNHKLFPGSTHLSHESMTLWSGIFAVISVNVVIAFYIYMAMKEPSDKHEPDPKFLADAKASIKRSRPSEVDSLSERAKRE